MVALFEYKQKIPMIIILCTFNVQYIFVRKMKFYLISIEVILLKSSINRNNLECSGGNIG